MWPMGFLLGVAEAGFFPGIVFYTDFFPHNAKDIPEAFQGSLFIVRGDEFCILARESLKQLFKQKKCWGEWREVKNGIDRSLYFRIPEWEKLPSGLDLSKFKVLKMDRKWLHTYLPHADNVHLITDFLKSCSG